MYAIEYPKIVTRCSGWQYVIKTGARRTLKNSNGEDAVFFTLDAAETALAQLKPAQPVMSRAGYPPERI